MPIQTHTPLSSDDDGAPRSVMTAMQRGAMRACPNCGTGALFNGYLKVADTCNVCGTELHHQRADDAPPYFVMFIVGHIALAGVLAMHKAFKPETWVQLAVWLPVTLILSLALLPIVKGGFIGLQWALRMHGFGGATDDDDVPDRDPQLRPPADPRSQPRP
ncbi:MAG: DUF983 domain-containing protein [Pseudomonadota bacterium]